MPIVPCASPACTYPPCVDARASRRLWIGEIKHSEVPLPPKPKSPIDKTLTERGGRYGDFTHNANYAQDIKDAMRESDNWHRMPDFAREALDFIASKIGRILSGDFTYTDSWHDIQGFAKLAEDRFKDQQPQEKC